MVADMSILDDIRFGRAGAPHYVSLLVAATGGRVDGTINAIAASCAKHFPAYGVNTAPRVSDVIAQTCNETGEYTRFEEDLRYSAKALLAQWPSHFTPEQAAAAVGNPVIIASRAYGGRMGNAPYPSRDGYIYRGRGMLELTGKSAYAAYGGFLGLNLLANPDQAADPAISTLIALEVYRRNGVFAAIDDGDLDGARRITNVGSRYARDRAGNLIKPIGLDHVNEIRARVLKAMGA